MFENVNDLFDKISKMGYQVLTNGELKKKGCKPVGIQKFYTDNFEIFKSVPFDDFQNIILSKAEKIMIDRIENGSDYSQLIAECEFLLDKYRWYVTDNFKKVFFLKTKMKTEDDDGAEEYKLITTQKDSDDFFNTLSNEELIKINEIVIKHNAREEKENRIDEEKLVKVVIQQLRKDPRYRLMDEPVTISNDRKTPCFKFFDLKKLEAFGDNYQKEYKKLPPTPAWDEFFERVREKEMVPVIKAFIAGIFVEENRTKQCLYIWGNGDDGKSQITDCLAWAMGDNISFVLDQYLRGNQFSSYDAYGKRLAIGEEMEAPNVIKNKTIHAITGNSRVRVEAKNEQAFQARLYCSTVITSNTKPLIENVKNQTSRLIYVEVDAPTKDKINKEGSTWGKQLKTEFRHLLYQGLLEYRKLNPNGSSFMLPASYQETLESLFDSETNHVEEYINTCFEAADDKEFIRDRIGDGLIEFLTINYFPDKNIPPEYKNSVLSRKIFEKLKAIFPHITQTRKKKENVQYRVITGLRVTQDAGFLLSIFEIE